MNRSNSRSSYKRYLSEASPSLPKETRRRRRRVLIDYRDCAAASVTSVRTWWIVSHTDHCAYLWFNIWQLDILVIEHKLFLKFGFLVRVEIAGKHYSVLKVLCILVSIYSCLQDLCRYLPVVKISGSKLDSCRFFWFLYSIFDYISYSNNDFLYVQGSQSDAALHEALQLQDREASTEDDGGSLLDIDYDARSPVNNVCGIYTTILYCISINCHFDSYHLLFISIYI